MIRFHTESTLSLYLFLSPYPFSYSCNLIYILLDTTFYREYPEYHFHFLSYDRVEYLDLKSTKSVTESADFTQEFIYSIANLFLSVDGADYFLGSLTSSWCTMTNILQRTRGDGGTEFLSVDSGSVYSACF